MGNGSVTNAAVTNGAATGGFTPTEETNLSEIQLKLGSSITVVHKSESQPYTEEGLLKKMGRAIKEACCCWPQPKPLSAKQMGAWDMISRSRFLSLLVGNAKKDVSKL